MWDTKRTRSLLANLLLDTDAESRSDRIVRNGFWCPPSLPKPNGKVIELETWQRERAIQR